MPISWIGRLSWQSKCKNTANRKVVLPAGVTEVGYCGNQGLPRDRCLCVPMCFSDLRGPNKNPAGGGHRRGRSPGSGMPRGGRPGVHGVPATGAARPGCAPLPSGPPPARCCAPRPAARSGPGSAYRAAAGGRPRWPRTGGPASTRGRSGVTSCRGAPVRITARGMPWASVSPGCLLPGWLRSVRWGPVFPRPHRTEGGAVDAGSGPVQWGGLVQLGQQALMQA